MANLLSLPLFASRWRMLRKNTMSFTMSFLNAEEPSLGMELND